MSYDDDKCAQRNVLEHVDDVFARAILLSQQVREIVDHLCGPRPEPIDKRGDKLGPSAFGHLRDRADDALSSMQAAKEALHRLESDVGFHDAEVSEPKASKARFAC